MPGSLLPHLLGCLCFVLLLSVAPTQAQDIIMSNPSEQTLAPVLRELQSPPPASSPPQTPTTPFFLGPFLLHPQLSYSYLNVEGLPTRDGRRVASEIHTVSAGLTADLSRNWTLDYRPTWLNYTARAMADSFDQSVNLSGALNYQDWGVQFTQSYSDSSPTLIETGQQTKQETWATQASVAYTMNPRIQVQTSAGVNSRFTDITTDTRTWSVQARLNYIISPRLSLNFGPSYSYTEIADAADLSNDQYTVGVNWMLADKLSIKTNLGQQYTRSQAAAGVDSSNPLFDVSVGYQLFETTAFFVTGTKKKAPSYFRDQVTESTQWSAGLQQRLFGYFYGSVTYSRNEIDYSSTNARTIAGRADQNKTFQARLTTRLFKRLTVSATWQQTKNSSNLGGFSFLSKQMGIQFSCNY